MGAEMGRQKDQGDVLSTEKRRDAPERPIEWGERE